MKLHIVTLAAATLLAAPAFAQSVAPGSTSGTNSTDVNAGQPSANPAASSTERTKQHKAGRTGGASTSRPAKGASAGSSTDRSDLGAGYRSGSSSGGASTSSSTSAGSGSGSGASANQH
jgi:hypothetical protein